MPNDDDLPKLNPSEDQQDNNPEAADLIRSQMDKIYSNEPDLEAEERVIKPTKNLSKHQQFIEELNKSGVDMPTMQMKWHEYYNGLSEDERQEVWKEFYDSQNKDVLSSLKQNRNLPAVADKSEVIKKRPKRTAKKKKKTARVSEEPDINTQNKKKLKAKHHLQSVFFGIGTGLIVVFIFLFGFFNEVIIAPFIQPGRTSASTPIIVNNSGVAPTSSPEVIIPKINVQIPVDYSVNTTDENVIENNLNSGVVHYPTTVQPGQNGNAAYFGHSSNNIFNSGKYKFAFVLLHTLQNGDTFYLTYNSKVYVYQVISKTIVNPSDVSF